MITIKTEVPNSALGLEYGIKEGFSEEVVCALNLQDPLSDKEDKAGERVLGKG